MDRAIRRIGEPGAVVDLQIRRILTDDEGKRAVQRAVFFQDKKLFVTDSVVNQLLRRKMVYAYFSNGKASGNWQRRYL